MPQTYMNDNHDCIELEYDGYAIKSFMFPNEECMACCDKAAEKTFRLNRNRYFLRSQLFGFQRWFGKWGGEQVPEWDRSYSIYYFVLLQSYRVHLPRCLQVNHYWTNPIVPDDIREKIAASIRNKFLQSLPDCEEVDNIPSMVQCGFDKNYVTSQTLPKSNGEPFILALSYNARLIADGGSGVELSCYYESDQPCHLEKSKRFASEKMRNIFGRAEYSFDESENGMCMNLLAVELLRKRYLMDSTTIQYAHFMLLYLHLYRTNIPTFVRIEPYASKWDSIPFKTKESIAAKFRKTLAKFRERNAKRTFELDEKQAEQGRKE